MLWHRCVAEIRSEWRTLLAQVVRDRKLVLLLFLIQLTAYSYLFTTISFSNHLFPNAFLNPYPSFRTTSQGRWLLDLIIFFAGWQRCSKCPVDFCDGPSGLQCADIPKIT